MSHVNALLRSILGSEVHSTDSLVTARDVELMAADIEAALARRGLTIAPATRSHRPNPQNGTS